MDKSNEKNNKKSNRETRRINFLRECSAHINGEIKPLTGEKERGYEINKISMETKPPLPGNDR